MYINKEALTLWEIYNSHNWKENIMPKAKDDELLQKEIYNYLLNSPDKKRKKKDLREHFNLTVGELQNVIDKMTQDYPIYEGRGIFGILIR